MPYPGYYLRYRAKIFHVRFYHMKTTSLEHVIEILLKNQHATKKVTMFFWPISQGTPNIGIDVSKGSGVQNRMK